MLICGQGCVDFAVEHNFPLCDNKALITPTAHSRWKKWKQELDKVDRAEKAHNAATTGVVVGMVQADYRMRNPTSNNKLSAQQAVKRVSSHNQQKPVIEQTAKDHDADHITDTVGAICVDRWGRVAAGSSSGGIGMKRRGRVGPAALIGVGTWVKIDGKGKAVAATCSGK